MRFQPETIGFVFFLAATISASAQTGPTPQPSETVVERVDASVVMVLAKTEKGASVYATGVAAGDDGVFFTAYHAVRDAKEVQIRLKNGEVFDRATLVAFDERRDVAALRISGAGLPPLPVASLATVHPGQPVLVVSHPGGLSWTASSGIVSSVRMADEVPGAVTGFRIVQFSAPVSPGSSGGVVVDSDGRALGIVVGSMSEGQNLNFAVPLESVIDLPHLAGGTAFASGAALQPLGKSESKAPAREPAPPPRREPEQVFGSGSVSQVVAQPVNPGAPELSAPIQSHDPTQILRTFHTIYILSKTVYAKPEVIQSALQKEPAYAAWGLLMVTDPQVADLRLTIDRPLFTFTYTYELAHQNSGIILDTGRVKGASDGAVAPKIARLVMQRVATARGWPQGIAPTKKEKE